MKYTQLRIFAAITLLMGWLAMPTANAQTPFEGRIKMSMKVEGMEDQDPSFMAMMPLPKAMEYTMSGKNCRVVMEGGSMPVKEILSRVAKDGSTEGFIIDRVKKVAYKIGDDLKKKAEGKAAPKVTKGKETKTIMGYLCDLYEVETLEPNSGMTIKQKVWATKDIDVKLPEVSGSMSAKGIPGFPMRIEMDVMMFKMITEAIEVDKKPVAATAFDFPSTYKVEAFDPAKLTMPGMGGSKE